MNKWNARKPIIIGGCGRSGTTLLLSMIASNPTVYAIPYETRVFCPGAYSRHVDAGTQIDASKILRHLQQFIFGSSYTRWCEKTPKNVLFFGQILEAFHNNVHILHIVRDGRDVVTSVHPSNPSRFHVSPERWIQEVGAGLQFLNDRRVYTLKYEDLVTRTDIIWTQIWNFLEESAPALHEWHYRTSIQYQQSWIGRVAQIHSSSVGRWRDTRYGERIISLLRHKEAQRYLSTLGYL